MQLVEISSIQLVPMDWALGLEKSRNLLLLYMTHFSCTAKVDTFMKRLMVCFCGGCLWLGNHLYVDVDVIATITSFPKEGVDPVSFFMGKEQDTILFS